MRTKSDVAIYIVAAVAGLLFLVVGATAISYAQSKPVAKDGPVAQKSKHEVTFNDNGKTVTFPVGVHFSVFLDEENHPKKSLTCLPNGVVAPASDMPVAALPLYVVRFDTRSPGSCILTNKDFSVKIVVSYRQ